MDPSAEMDYVRGDVLGFVEITERPYGLGVPYDGSREKRKRSKILRPVLTNLSVKTEARSSGIGSKLLKACERAVVQWKFSEIVLEVEFDNEKALEWYKKRGYEEVFTDPSCRRFSTKGFFLTKERCAKICMRKEIGKGIPISVSSQSNPLDLFKSLRQAVFS
jgi:GNAT superfamily N-acetyltransferase